MWFWSGWYLQHPILSPTNNPPSACRQLVYSILELYIIHMISLRAWALYIGFGFFWKWLWHFIEVYQAWSINAQMSTSSKLELLIGQQACKLAPRMYLNIWQFERCRIFQIFQMFCGIHFKPKESPRVKKWIFQIVM